MRDAVLLAEYERLLHALVRKSFLSHPSIALVLEDMLRSDMVVLWELIGATTQAGPFESRFGPFMARLQTRADADSRVRNAVRHAIVAQLQTIDGYVAGLST